MMVVDRKEVPTTLVRHSGVVPQSFLRLAGFKVLLPEGEGFRVRVIILVGNAHPIDCRYFLRSRVAQSLLQLTQCANAQIFQ